VIHFLTPVQRGLDVSQSDETTSFDLSGLKSRLNELRSAHTSKEAESSNIAIFGHDRNPYIANLKAHDSRLVKTGGFSIGWLQAELESYSKDSEADISREVESFAKLIPDLSHMLADHLCLPDQLL
jgi:hypothetical protein